MENEDEELLKKLTAYGCQIPNEAKTLKDIPHNLVLSIAQKCIDILSGEPNTIIPKNKGDQVLLASRIAATCKDLGYEGELGYDLFIYPNEQDLRSVLTFLLSKLSDDNKKIQDIDLNDNVALLMKKISNKINEELDRPWFPVYCMPKGYKISSDGEWTRDGCCFIEPFRSNPFAIKRDTKNITKAFQEYWNNIVPPEKETIKLTISEETKQANAILDKLKTKGNFNIKVFHPKPNNSNMDVEENNINDQNKSKDSSNEIDIENLDMETLLNNKQSILKTIFLSEEKEQNIQLLESKLLNNINDLKENIHNYNAKLKNEEINKQVEIPDDEYTLLEKQIKKKAAKLKNAKKNLMQLSASPDKERLIRANNVIETIEHLQKLQVDMSNIILNINTTQKDINRINGILDRSFVVADDLIFKDAKKDDFARKTYKLVANVHTECNELCNMVEEIGIFTRDTVDLEKNIETALKKNTQENLERAIDDLKNLVKQ